MCVCVCDIGSSGETINRYTNSEETEEDMLKQKERKKERKKEPTRPLVRLRTTVAYEPLLKEVRNLVWSNHSFVLSEVNGSQTQPCKSNHTFIVKTHSYIIMLHVSAESPSSGIFLQNCTYTYKCVYIYIYI